ncbi:glycerate kinase [Ornithinimicrobium pratense]|uniref:Glycerate kinase n=1 Tax=Ornithinimicrobium pratense TaxID=2593973 RepID=A0A5J6V7Y2_9MICO|nr:glycerate kinase [Ornithinimicrobium pratense]QFG69959.1 glycerate kinase [Ornithinimicrobium pratense]
MATAPTAPRVLLAPDKFKGTLTAAEVAGHLAEGIALERPDAEVVVVPVADGGDGLLAAAAAAGFERVEVTAAGPLGEPVRAAYAARAGGREAVVEMAEVCGLARLRHRLAPMTATSRGLGDVVAHALDAGATSLLVGIGGSASTDGGAGLLQALGARLLDADGAPVGPGGAGLERLAALDLSGLHPRLATARLTVACDVDNPLTGPHGAAAVYGPQKGADEDHVRALDAGVAHLAEVVARHTGQDLRDTPGAGAAGGVGFAALAVLGAVLRPGAEVVLELTGFHDALPGADLVVTGEGSLDGQTLHGKAPAAVAAAARAAGVPVVAVAGRVALDEQQLRQAGFRAAHALADLATYPQESFTHPEPLLREVGRRIARELPGPDPSQPAQLDFPSSRTFRPPSGG